jgi:hypothetical protein
MEPIIINNILPKETNFRIIKELCNHHWFIAFDNKNDRVEKIFSKENNGFNLETIRFGKIEVESVLNIYGFIILDIIKYKLNVEVEIIRFYWNMYFKGNNSELHKDKTEKGFKTIIYNLHTTDGGTEIEEKFYPDQMGQAKIFDSHLIHRGISPQQDNIRFNLNIIYKEKN